LRNRECVTRTKKTMQTEQLQIGRVKEYWDRRPRTIRDSLKPVRTNEYFDEVEARKYFVEPHIPLFAQLDRWQGKRVLEIGCGIGTDTINFVRNGAQVTAVDLSEKSLEIARGRSIVYGVQDRAGFISGNAEELGRFVPVEPYDLIYITWRNSSHAKAGTRAAAIATVRPCGDDA
jgi:2-polyprenyl-3-methyl-5-hydroxy-6-metoxy-1,4-benzoquinol methylase